VGVAQPSSRRHGHATGDGPLSIHRTRGTAPRGRA